MSKDEIRQTVADFGTAARNGLEAGFDGVQIQANFLYRPLYNGHLIANVDMTQERGNPLIKTGLADSIAFGRPFIANPDLPERFLTGATLNQISWPTVYASGPEGYTDYPAMRGSSTDEDSPKRARRQTEPLPS